MPDSPEPSQPSGNQPQPTPGESLAQPAAAATDDLGPVDPPVHTMGIIRCIGPGLIVAGSIVGSGELIATTKTGAEAGFTLLWLIILGCVVKVFAQVELGRYALISGKTTLLALDEVPGPRIKGRGNWLVWYWLVMWMASISQLGGIVGGVGQALAISAPITEMGRDYNLAADATQLKQIEDFQNIEASSTRPTVSWEEYTAKYGTHDDGSRRVPNDAKIWATIVAIATSIVLVLGRYNLIQSLSTILVASFTALTVLNLFLLQGQDDFRVKLAEFWSGLVPNLPERTEQINPVGTALATFGIIGVGAAELIAYPYWCLEKGYAQFTGQNDESPQWQQRAVGWMRVMRFDAWGAMIIYTFATVAFYLLGAAVLHRVGLNPEKDDMVRTLAVMFRPVFSNWAAAVFLFGAFAVLYSTFFVANAAHARTFSDALRVVGLIDESETTRQRWIRLLSGIFPILCLVIYIAFPAPAQLVLLSGVTQGIMLPMLAAAALFFRYRRCVPSLTPGKIWDGMLWLSAIAMLITGTWTVIVEVEKFIGK